jgi:hypothetical protein
MSNVAKFALENPDSIRNMAKDIRQLLKKSCTEAVNETAFEARKNLVARINKEFYVRNKFLTSANALSVTKSPFGHIDSLRDIKSSVGFTEAASFMVRQDEGGWHEPNQGKRLRIFTDKAREGGTKAGQVQRGLGYTKNLRRMGIIPLMVKGSSHASRMVRRAAAAYKSGMLTMIRRSFYRITDFKKKGDNVTFKKEMIINREFEKTYTPAKDFFLPECQKAAKDIQARFNAAMDRN